MKKYLACLSYSGGIFWAVRAALNIFQHPLLAAGDVFISSVLFFTASVEN